MKKCPKCGLDNQTSSPYCAKCRNAYQRAWYKKHPGVARKSYRKRHTEIRNLVKASKAVPCLDCKRTYPWYVMDLDHIRGQKKFALSVAAVKMWGLDTVKLEIEKCDPVCSNCHRERTYQRGRK